VSPLARALVAELRERPRHFGELVEAHMDAPWRDFLRAWGEVRAADVLARDDAGRYVINAEVAVS
jgi:ABC-type iron transport system FetAB ATPase subunit